MGEVAVARRVALDALLDFEQGSAVDQALSRALSRHLPADPRDRALVTELVYGVVRRLRALDFALDAVATRPVARMEPPVRAILRLAVYQLLYLDRVPAHAVVHQAVDQARAVGKDRSAGFINAVLRALQRDRDRLAWPDRRREPVRYLCVAHSHPEWIVRRWLARLGFEETEALCAANNRRPELTLRVNRLRREPAAAADALAAAGAETSPGRLFADALRVHAQLAPDDLPGYAEGAWTPQDEGSMLAAVVLDPRPGERVLDACAAPGTKTTHLAERMDDRGDILALDADPARIDRIAANAGRLRLQSVRWRCGDARRAEELVGAAWADRALVDAPCTGLGTLARRPDLRWRKRPGDVGRLAALQREILAGVAPVVRPGGVLVYSTCTTEPEENEQVVRDFLSAHPDYRLEPVGPWLPEALRAEAGGEGWLQVWPHRHGVDGFFIARLRRQPAAGN
ncbi:MAG TPA: 16S rRNA (cytosine(967)-C(5))-methyltransferase RsmB [Bacillota bacterium]